MLERIHMALKRWMPLAFGLAVQLVLVAEVCAKEAAKTGAEKSNMKYYLGYMLVFFLVVLGMLLVCRPTHRTSGLEGDGGGSLSPGLPGTEAAESDSKKK